MKKKTRPSEIAARLRSAMEREPRQSIGELERRLKKMGVKGSSHAMIYAYLDGRTPSIEFLSAAAQVTGVRKAWLVFGDGPMTDADEEFEQQRALLGQLQTEDQRLIASLIPGPDRGLIRWRRAAILRFAQKLDDVGHSEVPWISPPDRRRLITAAVDFLREVDAIFVTVGKQHPNAKPGSLADRVFEDHLLLRTSSSAGWYTAWSDQVLALFSSRVFGLGERSTSVFDRHNSVLMTESSHKS